MVPRLAVDPREHLIQKISPMAGFHPRDPPLPDLRGKLRAKPMPPETEGFVTDVGTPFMEQILYILQRKASRTYGIAARRMISGGSR